MNVRKLLVLACILVVAGCKENGLTAFWDDVPLLEENLSVSEDRFAGFAELAADVPEEEAMEALDKLFDRLQEDKVAYYVYAEWMEGAFYNFYSPCRSATLFSHVVQRIVSDGILSADECAPLQRKLDWIEVNQPGAPAMMPGIQPDGRRTLVVVLNLGCPACREALTDLASQPEWADVRRVALCCGHGPSPDAPGWEYAYPEHAASVFDLDMTPAYFVVAPSGLVEQSYTPVDR